MSCQPTEGSHLLEGSFEDAGRRKVGPRPAYGSRKSPSRRRRRNDARRGSQTAGYRKSRRSSPVPLPIGSHKWDIGQARGNPGGIWSDNRAGWRITTRLGRRRGLRPEPPPRPEPPGIRIPFATFHLFPLPYAASSVFQPIRSLGVQPRANPNAARLSSEGVEALAR